MFCPGCGAQAADDIKFCKLCGSNLNGVREAMTSRGEKFDWNKTWLADILLTGEELDRVRGITPEKKRNNEIRAGVITSAVGIGVMIFLRYLLEAVARQNGADAEIINRVWLAGVIPLFVGLALIFNALVLGRREVKMNEKRLQAFPQPIAQPPQLEAKTTSQLASAAVDYSVTEDTTAHLPEHEVRRVRRESE